MEVDRTLGFLDSKRAFEMDIIEVREDLTSNLCF